MKTLKALIILILFLMLLVPRVLVWTLKALESILRILRTTISFFIKQIEDEILGQKPITHGR